MKKQFTQFVKNKNILFLICILLLSMGLRSSTFLVSHNGFDEVVYQTLGKKVYHAPFDYTLRNTDFLTYKVIVFGHDVPVPRYYDEPLFHLPPLFVYMIAISYHLFGIETASAALVPFLFGGLTCLAIFMLGKKLFDKNVGLLASLFYAVSSASWISGSKIWNDVPLSFFVVIAIYFFYLGVEKDELKFIILAGFFEGLALLTKQSAILVLPAVLIYMLILNKNFNWSDIKKIAVFYFISFLFFTPWLIWVTSVYKVPWYLPEISKETLMASPWHTLVMNRPWYYLLITIPLTVPFYFFSYMNMVKTEKERSKFLIIWVLVFLIFFTVYPSGGELRFLIPALPALDIIAAVYIRDKWEKNQHRKLLLILVLSTMVMSLYIGAFKVYTRSDLISVLPYMTKNKWF